ncbi:EAL domain-containing protein [Undibacterium sp. CY18W]|uniref:EAL domain-containing protein n=1 Tax=Undibacterium hunanense TaxID=2762292 RepID=A0ABR6ZRM5_9BURK|nr:EAL domain-containing protein [Undibacterium hunanense]MBC3918531.1 EAL domain-containing protein [Undibacterium hunanense]
MHYPALQNYLSRLQSTLATTNLWLDEQGRARGRYFNSTLTSAFQAIRSGDDGRVVAYEAYARSYASDDQGLNIWKLLENAANDDESVELDRLCRLLHTLNFYRQPESAQLDLYLSVHSRLLAAVEGNHGMAFRRILDVLELPHHHVILQLPQITPSQRWVLTHVAENYRRNGFRIGLHSASLEQASDLLDRIRPDSIKVDISLANDAQAQVRLLEQADRGNCHVIFRRIENQKRLQALREGNQTASPYLIQGFLFDLPKAGLLSRAEHQQAVLFEDTVKFA